MDFETIKRVWGGIFTYDKYVSLFHLPIALIRWSDMLSKAAEVAAPTWN